MKGDSSRLTAQVQSPWAEVAQCIGGTGWGVRETENKGRPVITRALGPFLHLLVGE